MLSNAQQAEVDKYDAAYQSLSYRMGNARKLSAIDQLMSYGHCKSFLDVGCGRGELLSAARKLGIDRVSGIEVVKSLTGADVALAPAWKLPCKNSSFEVVGMFDVVEHLLPEDTERTLIELERVARKRIIITAANCESIVEGNDLHINKRSFDEWHWLFNDIFTGQVRWQPNKFKTVSETWVVDYG